MVALLSAVWGFLRSGAGKLLAILGIIGGAALMLLRMGARGERRKHRIKDLEAANETRKRGSEARRDYDGADASHDELAGRLRNRGRLRDE